MDVSLPPSLFCLSSQMGYMGIWPRAPTMALWPHGPLPAFPFALLFNLSGAWDTSLIDLARLSLAHLPSVCLLSCLVLLCCMFCCSIGSVLERTRVGAFVPPACHGLDRKWVGIMPVHQCNVGVQSPSRPWMFATRPMVQRADRACCHSTTKEYVLEL